MPYRVALIGAVFAALAALPAAAQQAPPLPVDIAPTDLHVRYIGRFDASDPRGPRCAWSASEVQFGFHGTAANAVIDELGNDRYQVVLDGKPAAVLVTQNGVGTYAIVTGLQAADHTVELIKRTEPFVGRTQFRGYQLSLGAVMLPLPADYAAGRRIEVIGDSISCGYGNEATDRSQTFSPATENAYMTYGAIAARTMGAQYVCIAWSGRKMAPDNTIGDVYDFALPNDPSTRWDFMRWTPDVVLINLGTNDFGVENPDRKAWTTAYEAFIRRLRANYPKAFIYCVTGPMMSDSWPPNHNALTTLKSYLAQILEEEHKAGDTRIRELDFAQQDQKNGIGADWHPSVKTHEIMAAALEEALQRDLGWRPAASQTAAPPSQFHATL